MDFKIGSISKLKGGIIFYDDLSHHFITLIGDGHCFVSGKNEITVVGLPFLNGSKEEKWADDQSKRSYQADD